MGSFWLGPPVHCLPCQPACYAPGLNHIPYFPIHPKNKYFLKDNLVASINIFCVENKIKMLRNCRTKISHVHHKNVMSIETHFTAYTGHRNLPRYIKLLQKNKNKKTKIIKKGKKEKIYRFNDMSAIFSQYIDFNLRHLGVVSTLVKMRITVNESLNHAVKQP